MPCCSLRISNLIPLLRHIQTFWKSLLDTCHSMFSSTKVLTLDSLSPMGDLSDDEVDGLDGRPAKRHHHQA